MKDGKTQEANEVKDKVAKSAKRISEIDDELPKIQSEIKNKMMMIPNRIKQPWLVLSF